METKSYITSVYLSCGSLSSYILQYFNSYYMILNLNNIYNNSVCIQCIMQMVFFSSLVFVPSLYLQS